MSPRAPLDEGYVGLLRDVGRVGGGAGRREPVQLLQVRPLRADLVEEVLLAAQVKEQEAAPEDQPVPVGVARVGPGEFLGLAEGGREAVQRPVVLFEFLMTRPFRGQDTGPR
jgi:hypothetical protein